MAEVDREMIDEYGIDLLIMMENAGKALAQLAKRTLSDFVEGKKIAVLTGKGNNGGGGLVAARHLHNWGASIHVILGADEGELKDAPRKQLEILRRIGVEIGQPE
ncbi:MAG: NAD(P)H-hydrate epimerase, partial [Nitrososphaerales archaeon]